MCGVKNDKISASKLKPHVMLKHVTNTISGTDHGPVVKRHAQLGEKQM